MRKYAIATVAAAVALAVSGAALAGTKSTSFNVTANVADNCVVSATDLAFGAFDASADVTNSSSVKVRCTNGTAYTILLGAGNGTVAARAMKNAANNSLFYNLFTTNAYTSVWGDGSGTSVTKTGTGAGLSAAAEQTHTVFGKLPVAGNQDAPVGSYSDNISVTVNY